LPEDAVYPLNIGDADGKPLIGANKYVLHFSKDEMPPAKAFWSVTLYDKDGFPSPNDLKRNAIGDRDALRFNADGSAGSVLSARVARRRKRVELVARTGRRLQPDHARVFT
jgi:hypothetical protein